MSWNVKEEKNVYVPKCLNFIKGFFEMSAPAVVFSDRCSGAESQGEMTAFPQNQELMIPFLFILIILFILGGKLSLFPRSTGLDACTRCRKRTACFVWFFYEFSMYYSITKRFGSWRPTSHLWIGMNFYSPVAKLEVRTSSDQIHISRKTGQMAHYH